MTSPRIAVSGLGIVSALGQSASQSWSRLMNGERGLRALSLFDAGDVRSTLVGEVPDLHPAEIRGRATTDYSRTDAMAVAAAREAVAQARPPLGARFGVVLGGTTGGMLETEQMLSSPELAALPPERAQTLVSYPLSASLAHVEAVVGRAVRRRSVCSACSGGAIALVQAAAWLARGEVDFVLAGGADGLCRLTLLGFNALGITDAAPCRPFDRARAGLNLGEGAAVLVLEREESAARRGASVLALLDGYAVGAEAHHITHPEPSGRRAVELMQKALTRAGLEPGDVDYVNAHGTGTPQNDAMEAAALREVFGADAETWVSSSKAQLGHTLGAAGAIEAAISVLALSRGAVPPAIGLSDPELPGLRHVRAAGQRARLSAVLSNSFGFGGMSCVLAFSAPARRAPPRAQSPRRIVMQAARTLGADAQPEQLLAPERSRRFDQGSALAAAGASALATGAPTGLVLGTAFGNVERTMAFLSRGRARGARHVPPAEFPHLVPSAPAGNASVYAGLAGPVFAVSELAQSGEAAFAAACDLIELGVADSIVAGGVAARDAIVERVLGPLLDVDGFRASRRGTGAGFVLLAAAGADAVGIEVLLRFSGHALPFDDVPAPAEPGLCLVVLGAAGPELRRALDASAWATAARVDLAERHGYHEALGALALSSAFELLTAGNAERALVLSGAAGSFTATLLGRAREGG